LTEILDLEADVIPLGKLAFFRERFRHELHQLVLRKFLALQDARGFTKRDLARRIGRKPEQVTRWLGAPGNLTLDTVSDLLLGMAAEIKGTVVDLAPELTEVRLPLTKSAGQPAPSSPLRGHQSSKSQSQLVPSSGILS
jgi:hypothetical protein